MTHNTNERCCSKALTDTEAGKNTLAQLVLQAKNGNRAAFDVLVERFRAFAMAVAQERVGDRSLAQDAVQESFVETWLYLPRLNYPHAFPQLLRRSVIKQCDRLTRRSSVSIVSLEEIIDTPSPDRTIDSQVNAIQERAFLKTVLQELSILERSALLQHEGTGESLVTVADTLGITVSALKSRLYRVRHRLREEIDAMRSSIYELLSVYLNQVDLRNTAEGPVPDAGLLTRIRNRFDNTLKARPTRPVSFHLVQTGFTLYQQMRSPSGSLRLLERYLAQTLTFEEALWAHWHRVNVLYQLRRGTEAVTAHRQLRDFANTGYAQLCRIPYYLPNTEPYMAQSELSLWLLMPLGISAVPEAWYQEGVGQEWSAWAEETLTTTSSTVASHRLREYVRQTVISLSQPVATRIEQYARFQRQAMEERNTREALRWHVEGALLRQQSTLSEGNGQADVTALLAHLETAGGELDDFLCSRIACFLMRANRFDIALELLRPEYECKRLEIPSQLQYAISLWQATDDEDKVALLLRQVAEKQRRSGHYCRLEQHPYWNEYRLGNIPAFITAVTLSPGK